MKVFRFDDICINSDIAKVQEISKLLLDKFDCKVIWAVSPLVHNDCGERIFPKIMGALSDYRNFYKVDDASLTCMDYAFDGIQVASHGLIHIDHRLLHKKAQEMSILTSCSLTKSHVFVPPFNKWNKDTEEICDANNIALVKFEYGWLSMEHNKFKRGHNLWYLHHRDFGIDKVKEWIK